MAKKWLEEIRNNSNKNTVIIFIGNKSDLEDKRKVSYKEGETFAKENGLMFLETSNKTSNNIIETVNLSAECILNNIERTGINQEKNSNINLNKDNKEDMNRQNKIICC